MSSTFWLQQAISEFRKGSSLFFVKDGNANKLHQRLRRAARRRGYWSWVFATDGNQVIIRYKNSLTKN